MKKTVIVLIILILIGAFYISRNSDKQNQVPASPTPTISSGNNVLGFCKLDDLNTSLTPEGAAGNIFITLTIKNASAKNCKIIGNNYVLPLSESQSIIVKNQGEKGPEVFVLSPNQIVYSQIHYPNGPECSGQTKLANISYSYKFSADDSIAFKDANNNTKLTIPVCQTSSELTQIDAWSLSEKSVNQ